ncbi:hypothetical protein AB6A40_003202 [Gnathostoma spinigerum]|uniref:Uncharacterized protein n=1 Tax=Gnathostoma spinigerum TaxID=75299 RepID=A0ABD6E8U1_9BILA
MSHLIARMLVFHMDLINLTRTTPSNLMSDTTLHKFLTFPLMPKRWNIGLYSYNCAQTSSQFAFSNNHHFNLVLPTFNVFSLPFGTVHPFQTSDFSFQTAE